MKLIVCARHHIFLLSPIVLCCHITAHFSFHIRRLFVLHSKNHTSRDKSGIFAKSWTLFMRSMKNLTIHLVFVSCALRFRDS